MHGLIANLMALIVAAAPQVVATDSTCKLDVVEHVLVADVIDGDTVRLKDGRQLRLVGTQAPKFAHGQASAVDWPLAAESKKALADLIEGKTVGLAYGGLRSDRNGRTLAHAYLDGSDDWVQGAMISAGMARVFTAPDNRSCAAELLAREVQARAAEHGIWALPFYRIRRPTELDDAIDTFQIVEGRVASAADVRGRLYLNYGHNYKTDFTVTIAPEDMKAFKSVALDLRVLLGKTIRVRGWISLQNGPEIEATHPEQIEILR